MFLDSSNALQIMQDYDIIVDGSDNFDTRYLINDACIMLNKPMVSGAIYKFEVQDLFLIIITALHTAAFSLSLRPPRVSQLCNIGVIASLPGIIGTIQANEVLRVSLV